VSKGRRRRRRRRRRGRRRGGGRRRRRRRRRRRGRRRIGGGGGRRRTVGWCNDRYCMGQKCYCFLCSQVVNTTGITENPVKAKFLSHLIRINHKCLQNR